MEAPGFVATIIYVATLFDSVTGLNANIYGKTGSTLVIKCPVKSNNRVIWRGPPRLQFYSSHGNIVSALKDKVIVNHSPEGIGTLTIMNYTSAAEGLYQCETIVNGQVSEKEISVLTAVVPEIMNICKLELGSREEIWPLNPNPVVTADEGSFHSLSCSILNCGRPRANVYWTVKKINEDVAVISNDTNMCFAAPPKAEDVLLEMNTTADHHGAVFTCVADNSITSTEKSVSMIVYTIPLVMVLSDTSTNVVPERSNITLTCKVSTNTYPTTIAWEFNNQPIGDEQKFLTITQIGPQHFGTYKCEASNRIGSRADNYNLFIVHRPLPMDESSGLSIFEAYQNTPTDIYTTIRSFPKPNCSWIGDKGAKLSTIIVQHIRLNIFLIKASILITTDKMLGEYSLRVRNEIGAMDMSFHLIGRISNIYPDKSVCNVTNTVVFSCTIHSHPGEVWTSVWFHHVSGNLIRTLPGETNHNVSVLEINFCDYRDAGSYTCQWKLGKNITSTSVVELSVNGQPIIASHRIERAGYEMLRFEVLFISVPEPLSVVWLINDKPFEENDLNMESVKQTEVPMFYHGRIMRVQGYGAFLVLNIKLARNHSISCIIGNAFGYGDQIFTRSLIQETIFMAPNSNVKMLYIYIIAAAIFLVAFIVGIGILIKIRKRIICFHKLDHRALQPASAGDIQLHTSPDTDTREHNEIPSDSEYEEIPSLHQSLSAEDENQSYVIENRDRNSEPRSPITTPVYLDLESKVNDDINSISGDSDSITGDSTKSHDDMNSSSSYSDSIKTKSQNGNDDIKSSSNDSDSLTRDYLDPTSNAYEDLLSNNSDPHVYCPDMSLS